MGKLSVKETNDLWSKYLEEEEFERENFIKIKSKKPKDSLKIDKKRNKEFKKYRQQKIS